MSHRMRFQGARIAAALLGWGLGVALAQQPAGAPAQEIRYADRFDFGAAGSDDPIEHTFRFANEGDRTLEIAGVQMAPPLTVTRLSARVNPGETGTLTVRLGTPRPAGEFKSPVVLRFKDETVEPKIFLVAGRIVEPIGLEPYGAFFVAARRGETRTASIDIVNHLDEPLEILRVESPSTRFSTELRTLEAGRRYRLSLTLKGEGPAGKQQDTITVLTSSTRQPRLAIQANTLIRERVYAFPDELDFGTLDPRRLESRPDLVAYLHQTLMVYRYGGEDFEVTVSTDLPFLKLSPEASQRGDRYQIEVDVVPERLRAGRYDGAVLILTNDPEFPRLEVPVRAVVEGSE